MTIKHKCGDKTVFNEATRKTEQRTGYDGHADMHYDGGGWYTYDVTTYTVDKCSECGRLHYLKEKELL